MSGGEAFARLAALGTATVGEVLPSARLLDRGLRALGPGMIAAGPALTVRCRPGDNLALHLALAAARPGQVLAVDYGGSLDSGPFGEVMAVAAQARGLAGLVIDGAVRDSAQIVALGFPVFARGLDIRGTAKDDPGEIGAAVRLGGAEVASGEIVLADADAILVFPAEELGAALERGEARSAREARMMERLRAGETTLEVLGLQGRGAA